MLSPTATGRSSWLDWICCDGLRSMSRVSQGFLLVYLEAASTLCGRGWGSFQSVQTSTSAERSSSASALVSGIRCDPKVHHNRQLTELKTQNAACSARCAGAPLACSAGEAAGGPGSSPEGHAGRGDGICSLVRRSVPLNLLEGSWDLRTTYNWAYNPTYSLPKWPYVGCTSCKYAYKPLCR